MNLRPIKQQFPAFHHCLIYLLAVTLLSGCAGRPWTEPLDDTAGDSVVQLAESLYQRDARCGTTLTGELMLSYQSPLEKKKVSGYLQFRMDPAYKFVVSNPFGQPLFVVAGNQKNFQAINTLQHKYLAGSIRSFGLRSDIPTTLLQGDWGAWLTGRSAQRGQEISDIRYDRKSRGVWLTFPNRGQEGLHHLLLDRDKQRIISRIVENGRGRMVAEIEYDKWVTLAGCMQPLEINITGLDYGTQIQLSLSDVDFSEATGSYQLPVPQGYIRQYLP